MKKSILTAAVVFALSAASSAYAGNTITFLGEITDSTCDVSVEGGSSTITLPSVSKSLLSATNSTAGRVSFALLAENCALGNGKSKVAAYFNGNGAEGADANNIDSATGYLNNLATDPNPTNAAYDADDATTYYQDAATNVQLRLIDGTSNAVIKAGFADQVDDAGYVTVDTSNNARLPYSVEYISVAGSATPGPVKGMVVYDLMYQ